LLRLAAWLHGAAIAPLLDFLRRYRWHAVLLLALIGTYRISDVVMGIMANAFYVDMGYTKDEVATVAKVYGVGMTIAGALIGGVLTARIGVMKTLFLGALLSSVTNLLFVWLAGRGHDVSGLIFAISADNLSAGIASSAFVAYLSGLTNVAYSATQYALFSSLMLLLPKFIAGLFRRGGGRTRLRVLLHRHRAARHPGASSGVAGGAARKREVTGFKMQVENLPACIV
jgi:PAT family beta-lactamase induction signal transducer AmpG